MTSRDVFRNKRAQDIYEDVVDQLKDQGKNTKTLQALATQYAFAYDRRLYYINKISRSELEYDAFIHKVLTDYGKEQERLAKLLGLVEVGESDEDGDVYDTDDLYPDD